MELSPFVLEPSRAFMASVAAFLPGFFAALLSLLFGWLLALFARLLVFRLLLAVRFDLASEKAGIDAVLLRADIRQGPADLVAVLVQWLVMLIAIMTAVNTVGLSSVSDLLNQILLYVPKVIAAVVVLIKAAAANVGLGEAEALASLARYAIMAFTAAVTLEEVGIAPDLVRSAFVILFGAVALGLALAFGLGCQDLARDWLIRYLDSARTRKRSH